MTPSRRAVNAAVVAVAVLAALAAGAGIGVRGIVAAHVAVDEVQYLLTALSLAEDGNLDIADELAEQRWRPFADESPPVQTSVRPDGRQVSPHDPLLPLLLAVPMGLGGWVATKAALALLAGLLAGLTLWVAVRRFAVPLPLAATGVALAAASAPLAVYGQQVYPELPAALATLAGVAVLTGPLRRGSLVVLAASVVALPWLSVKYAAVAAVLAVLGALRWWRAGRHREVVALGTGLAALGAGYLAVHRAVWGGWTVYASGDYFERTGEFSVVGTSPDYAGRALRLVGLLVDRDFGLVAWQPAWLLVVPALAALTIRVPLGLPALAGPLAAGWLTATFVALTMHGYWWPGRQVVVVLPLALLVVLCWLARSGPRLRAVAATTAAAGVLTYGWLLADGYTRAITWVSGFAETGAPTSRLLRPLLPDYRGDFWFHHLAWIAVLVLLAVLARRAARREWSFARPAAPPIPRAAPRRTRWPSPHPRRKELPDDPTPCRRGHDPGRRARPRSHRLQRRRRQRPPRRWLRFRHELRNGRWLRQRVTSGALVPCTNAHPAPRLIQRLA